eukprot:SAG11_NODE_3087_length_2703_cov_1.769201_2_plen_402_part_00
MLAPRRLLLDGSSSTRMSNTAFRWRPRASGTATSRVRGAGQADAAATAVDTAGFLDSVRKGALNASGLLAGTDVDGSSIDLAYMGLSSSHFLSLACKALPPDSVAGNAWRCGAPFDEPCLPPGYFMDFKALAVASSSYYYRCEDVNGTGVCDETELDGFQSQPLLAPTPQFKAAVEALPQPNCGPGWDPCCIDPLSSDHCGCGEHWSFVSPADESKYSSFFSRFGTFYLPSMGFGFKYTKITYGVCDSCTDMYKGVDFCNNCSVLRSIRFGSAESDNRSYYPFINELRPITEYIYLELNEERSTNVSNRTFLKPRMNGMHKDRAKFLPAIFPLPASAKVKTGLRNSRSLASSARCLAKHDTSKSCCGERKTCNRAMRSELPSQCAVGSLWSECATTVAKSP